MNVNLDDVETILKLDDDNQLKMMGLWPDLLEEGLNAGQELNVPQMSNRNYTTILICGMGGSAIAGDYIKSLAEPMINIPILINRGYHLPKFVSRNTLLICISYSGNTEETISMLVEAINNNLSPITLSSSGIVAKLAKQKNIPHIKIKQDLVPRAALAFIYGALLGVFNKLGILGDLGPSYKEVISTLRRQNENYLPTLPTANNPAKQLAKLLYNKIPIIVGHTFLTPVAYRAKCQFNENSKIHALAETIPEHDHNTIVALDNPAKSLGDFIYIFLRSNKEEFPLKVRIDETIKLTKEVSENIIELTAEGEHILTQQFYLTYLLDHVSIYLGILYELNPTKTPSINKLKKELNDKVNLVKNLLKRFDIQ